MFKKIKNKNIFMFFLVLGIVISASYFYIFSIRGIINNTEKETSKEFILKNNPQIHFLNTGNSDCIIIKGEKVVIIDGADNNDEELIVSYINNLGIKKIDYMISTHYHADHLGSLDRVIKEFEVENIFVSNGVDDSVWYKDFMKQAKKKRKTPIIPKEGEKIDLGGNAYMKIYNTNGGTYRNDESLVTLYVNGEDKILFAADAEAKVEKEILDKMSKVDLLKVGHHGSSTSSTAEFLDVLMPTYAVITVSETNNYANPAQSVMENLQKRNVEIHRTDECGHVVFISTGTGLKTTCPIGSYGYRVYIPNKKAA